MDQINFGKYLYSKFNIIIIGVFFCSLLSLVYTYIKYDREIKVEVVITPPKFLAKDQFFEIEEAIITLVNLESELETLDLKLQLHKKANHTLLLYTTGMELAALTEKIEKGIKVIGKRYEKIERNISGAEILKVSSNEYYSNIRTIKLDGLVVYLKSFLLGFGIGIVTSFGFIYLIAFRDSIRGNWK